MTDTSKLVACKKCGWIHFAVSLPYVQNWEDEWVTYWATLDDEGKDMFGVQSGPPKKDEEYLKCFRCRGPYKNFRDAKDDEIPIGSTIQGILDRSEDV